MTATSGMVPRAFLLLAILSCSGVRAAGDDLMFRTAWVSPTAGCTGSVGDSCYPNCPSPVNSRCDLAKVCQPTYLQTVLGGSLRFSMSASNPSTTTGAPYLVQVQKQPSDVTLPCCGFSNYFVYDWLSAQNPQAMYSPSAGGSGRVFVTKPSPGSVNTTQIEFEFNSTNQALVGTPPPVFNITLESQYGFYPETPAQTWTNVTSCRKVMYVRLCSIPSFASTTTFTDEPLAGGAYKPALGMGMAYAPNSACGLANHMACLTNPGRMEGDKLMLDMALSAGQGAMRGVRVGQRLDMTLSSKTLMVGSSVEIMVMADPGLPIGMSVGPDYPCGDLKWCKDLSWTPRKGQEGVTHQAHIQAVSTSSLPVSVSPCIPATSKHLVIGFPVLTPSSMWTDGLDAVFEAELEAVVGSPFEVHVLCKSNYRPLVTAMGVGGDAGRLVASEVLMSENPAGADGFRMGTFLLAMTPQRGDEGRVFDVEVRCGDDQMVEVGEVRHARVRVRLCAYTVEAGDTLSTLARRYHLSTNWLNLWNANPYAPKPSTYTLNHKPYTLNPLQP
ncbi:hypothetical protein T484DRAFT_3154781 [Baffinella frigidus]|nr:hypothetical protein T484DRAFT_3154781 [Cryptophyta sp. CCMP2293]